MPQLFQLLTDGGVNHMFTGDLNVSCLNVLRVERAIFDDVHYCDDPVITEYGCYISDGGREGVIGG